jgi:lipopolysaccharide export system ATP-binding protein
VHKLKAIKLQKIIKKTPIIKGVSLEINSGEVIGLFGPNGAGKTTTFYLICGLIVPDGGDIFFDDKNITKFPLHKKVLKGIGYLPQEASIFRDLSVEDNLYVASELIYGKDSLEGEKKVEEMLEKFNIENIRKRKGINLSGGERRRVEIARALIANPKFLFLDEPFAGVDPVNVNDIKALVRLLKNDNIGVLITDHNVKETLDICNRAYVLKDGEILASGTPKEIANDKNVKKYYLGEEFVY